MSFHTHSKSPFPKNRSEPERFRVQNSLDYQSSVWSLLTREVLEELLLVIASHRLVTSIFYEGDLMETSNATAVNVLKGLSFIVMFVFQAMQGVLAHRWYNRHEAAQGYSNSKAPLMLIHLILRVLKPR